MTLGIKNTKITLLIISWIQIIGGIIGLGLIASILLKTGVINGALLLIFLVGLILFWYSIYSGIKLLTDKTKDTAIILSIINQTMQIFQWNMLGYAFSYCAGVGLTLGIQGQILNLDFSALMSTFKMSINNTDEFFIKINLVAILLIFILFITLKKLRKNKRTQEKQIEELKVE